MTVCYSDCSKRSDKSGGNFEEYSMKIKLVSSEMTRGDCNRWAENTNTDWKTKKLTLSMATSTSFYGTRYFITVFTTVRHFPCPKPPNSVHAIQFTFKCISILFSHLRLVLPTALYASESPSRSVCSCLSCPARTACPTSLRLSDLVTPYTNSERDSLLTSTHCNR